MSILAQAVAIYCAWRAGDKSQVVQDVTLAVALILIVVAIQLRPPAPPNHTADILGTIAAVLLTAPAVHAVRERKKQKA